MTASDGSLGHQYADGEVIIRQGSEGNCLYVIQQGKVEVYAETGNKEVKLAELGKCDFFGEMGLFERDVRSCSVRSIGDTRILTIDKKNFYQTIQKDPSLAFRLLETLSHRIRHCNQKIAELQEKLEKA